MTVDLVARIQAGDVDAFETLYRQHSARIYTLACRMAGSPEDGEDLLQEIFLQAYRKLGSFKGDSALGTWLYRLALNHCLDYVRSRQAKMNKLTETLDAETLVRTDRAPRDADRAARSRARGRAAAGRLPRGVRAARRRRVRSQGSRPAARHRGRDVEVAGVQGAAEAARVSAREVAGNTCIRTTRPSTTTSTARSARPSGGASSSTWPPARRAGRWSTICARSCARPASWSCASRRSAPGRASSARSGWSASTRRARRQRSEREAVRRHGRRGKSRDDPEGPLRLDRWLAAAAALVLATAVGLRYTPAAARRRGAPARRAPAGAGRSGAVGRDRAAAGRSALREGDQGARGDRQQRAERARPADRGDAAEEPRGHRSGDQREPRGGARAAGQRAGAAEPDRRTSRPRSGCCRTPWRSSTKCAKATRRARRVSSPASNKRAPDMRLTTPFVIAGLASRPRRPWRRTAGTGSCSATWCARPGRARIRGATTVPSRPSASRAR